MSKSFRIENSKSGADLGVYEGETAADALDAMARDAGYADYQHCAETTGSDESDLIITEVA